MFPSPPMHLDPLIVVGLIVFFGFFFWFVIREKKEDYFSVPVLGLGLVYYESGIDKIRASEHAKLLERAHDLAVPELAVAMGLPPNTRAPIGKVVVLDEKMPSGLDGDISFYHTPVIRLRYLGSRDTGAWIWELRNALLYYNGMWEGGEFKPRPFDHLVEQIIRNYRKG